MTTTLTPAMRRSILIATLRDKTMWPKGFQWDYSHRRSCAIGLAERMFGMALHLKWSMFRPEFGLNDDQIMAVFNGWNDHQIAVTPAMVADRLEMFHRTNCATEETEPHEGHHRDEDLGLRQRHAMSYRGTIPQDVRLRSRWWPWSRNVYEEC